MQKNGSENFFYSLTNSTLMVSKSLAVAGITAAAIAAIIIVVVIVPTDVTTTPPDPPDITNTNDPNKKIGLVINTPGRSVSLQQADIIYADAASTGIGRSNVYMFWNVIEPQKGEFDWSQYDTIMALNEKNDLNVTLFFSVINGRTLGPFPDWIGKPSISAIGEQRLVDTLDAILSRYHIIDYVIIAGDTESQFRYNEQNIPVYKEFFTDVHGKLKQKHPDVMFANLFALHHLLNKNLAHIAAELAPLGDFVAFSYFPVDSLNDMTKTPQEARKEIGQVFEIITENRKAGFFEVSWSTSEFVGGDVLSQNVFMEELFGFYSENISEIEFLTWYRQYDRPEGACATDHQDIGSEGITVGGDSGLGGSEYVIERLGYYICNAGLIDVNGTSKPGWQQFKDQIAQLQQQSLQQQSLQQQSLQQQLHQTIDGT